MCPPSSEDSLLAWSTSAIAFQRMIARMRCSSSRSPGHCVLAVDRDRVDVGRVEPDLERDAAQRAPGRAARRSAASARSGPSCAQDGVEGLEPLAGLLRVDVVADRQRWSTLLYAPWTVGRSSSPVRRSRTSCADGERRVRRAPRRRAVHRGAHAGPARPAGVVRGRAVDRRPRHPDAGDARRRRRPARRRRARRRADDARRGRRRRRRRGRATASTSRARRRRALSAGDAADGHERAARRDARARARADGHGDRGRS